MLPVATNVGVGMGEGVGEGVGATVGFGLAVWLRLGEGEAGLPPHPTTARISANAANASPVERLPWSTPGLALTRCLPPSSEPLQDDASKERT